jgi:hypothetical protein
MGPTDANVRVVLLILCSSEKRMPTPLPCFHRHRAPLLSLLALLLYRGCVDLPRRATATTVGDAGAGTDGERLLPAFGELIKVWGVWQFQVLFLLTREDVRQELMMEGCSVEYLARVLVAEVFLLRLCLKVQNAAGVPVLSCRRSSGSGRAPFLFCRTSILRGPAQHALQPPSACLFIIECR